MDKATISQLVLALDKVASAVQSVRPMLVELFYSHDSDPAPTPAVTAQPAPVPTTGGVDENARRMIRLTQDDVYNVANRVGKLEKELKAEVHKLGKDLSKRVLEIHEGMDALELAGNELKARVDSLSDAVDSLRADVQLDTTKDTDNAIYDLMNRMVKLEKELKTKAHKQYQSHLSKKATEHEVSLQRLTKRMAALEHAVNPDAVAELRNVVAELHKAVAAVPVPDSNAGTVRKARKPIKD